MAKRWTKTEVAHLKRHAGSKSIEELAQRLHTDPETVRRKLTELGLLAGSETPDPHDPALAVFEKALPELYKGNWSKASELLTKALEIADGRQLRDRIRQLLQACARRGGKTKKGEDPYLEAVFEKNRGELEAARKICDRHGAAEDERFVYLRASLEALDGADEAALASLEEAIRLEPKNRVQAFHDPDFAALRGRREFVELLNQRA